MIERQLPKGIEHFKKPDYECGTNLNEKEIKKKIKEIKKAKDQEREDKLDEASKKSDEDIIKENIARRKAYEAKQVEVTDEVPEESQTND